MNIKKINHIGIVVKDLEAAKEKYSLMLGLTYLGEETIKSFKCQIAFFKCGETKIELVMPTGSGSGRDFLLSHGEGINHICYEVDSIDNAWKDALAAGITCDTIKNGAGGSKVFFLYPEKCCGVSTEIVELSKCTD